MTRIDFDGITATVTDGDWQCSDQALRDALQVMTDAMDIPGHEPDADLARARYVAEALGGKITKHEPRPQEPGRVY